MRSFVLTVQAADVELAADRLWQLGARAVEQRDVASGLVELWTVVGDDDGVIASTAARLDAHWSWRTEHCADDWPESWRDHAQPMAIGRRLLVVPAWQATDLGAFDDLDGSGDRRVRVLIEPEAAFGLGDHPTTALSLGALDRLLERRPAQTVLDVGCGTGVLSIAAALVGAGPIRAIDISTAAIDSTTHNARRNRVADRIEVDTAPLDTIDGEFDLVIANILAPALISMAGDLVRLTAPTGHLVVSGILADAHRHVLDALHPMRVLVTDTADGWAAVTLSHP